MNLDDLLDDMEDVYSVPENSAMHLSPAELRKGLHCAVKLLEDRKWYRAAITAVEDGMVS